MRPDRSQGGTRHVQASRDHQSTNRCFSDGIPSCGRKIQSCVSEGASTIAAPWLSTIVRIRPNAGQGFNILSGNVDGLIFLKLCLLRIPRCSWAAGSAHSWLTPLPYLGREHRSRHSRTRDHGSMHHQRMPGARKSTTRANNVPALSRFPFRPGPGDSRPLTNRWWCALLDVTQSIRQDHDVRQAVRRSRGERQSDRRVGASRVSRFIPSGLDPGTQCFSSRVPLGNPGRTARRGRQRSAEKPRHPCH